MMEQHLGLHTVLEHDDPLEALLDEIARSEAAVAFYAARVRELSLRPESLEDEHARLLAADESGEDPAPAAGTILEATMFGPVPSVWVKLWTDERIRHAKLSKMGIDAGLAERMAKVNEDVASRLIGAVLDALADPDNAVPAAMQTRLRVSIGRKVRQLQALPAAS